MDIAKCLETIGCEIKKPSIFQVDYKLFYDDNEYSFINGLVLSNWTVYNYNEGTVYEYNEKEMKKYIFENFIKEIRDTKIETILK